MTQAWTPACTWLAAWGQGTQSRNGGIPEGQGCVELLKLQGQVGTSLGPQGPPPWPHPAPRCSGPRLVEVSGGQEGTQERQLWSELDKGSWQEGRACLSRVWRGVSA